jgi:hypothetical protein
MLLQRTKKEGEKVVWKEMIGGGRSAKKSAQVSNFKFRNVFA